MWGEKRGSNPVVSIEAAAASATFMEEEDPEALKTRARRRMTRSFSDPSIHEGLGPAPVVEGDAGIAAESAPVRNYMFREMPIASPSTPGAGSGFIKVCVRVRPFNPSEKARAESPSVDIPSRSMVVTTSPMNGEQKRFSFDRAYWSVDPKHKHFAGQASLMEELGEELKDAALDGYNSCLFAYGQTGSGKTYSVLGSEASSEGRGLLPRIIEDIFTQIELLSNQDRVDPSVFTTNVSYLEIYNEQIRDLLAPEEERQTKREVRHNPKIGAFVPGIQDTPVFCWKDVEKLLEFGVKARAVGSTLMNETSSRSHCIFTLEITRKDIRAGKVVHLRSKLNLVDLAGSERQKRTQATGERLKEGSMINRSLSTLAVVVSKLAEQSTRKEKGKKKPFNDFVPFRNSKLTFLLQDSLSGNSKTIMIAALSPASLSYDETLSTLQFAQSVKAVKTKVKKNEELGNSLVMELEQECERLRTLIDQGGAHAQELHDLEEIKRRYGRDLETQLNIAQSLKEKRHQILADAGLTTMEMSESVGLAESTPQLLNVCYDPQLSGCLVYFLQQDQDIRIGKSKECKILLPGLGMEPQMAVITNKDDHKLSIKHLAGRVLLNGKQVQGVVDLMHNDRLIFGFSFCFRLVLPGAEQESSYSATTCTYEQVISEVVPEDFQAHAQCVFFIKELEGRLGETRARAFLQAFRKVCMLVEEANVIMRELRPGEGLHFSAEVLTDLFVSGSKVPQCVVRLKRHPQGAARWRHFVQKHFLKHNMIWEAMGELRLQVDDRGGYETVLLMAFQEFQERLFYFRDVHERWRREGLEVDTSEDPWQQLPPWAVERDHIYSLEEQLAVAETKLAMQPGPTAAVAGGLVGAHHLAGAGGGGAVGSGAGAGGVGSGGGGGGGGPGPQPIPPLAARTEEAHKALLDQVREAFEQGLKQGAAETEALQQYLNRMQAVESLHLSACRDLQAEVKEEAKRLRETSDRMTSEADENLRLREEARALRAELDKALAELVQERAASRAAFPRLQQH